ncbi:MAG: alpha/beta fold hydrolase [Planctomycetota bacterium]|nr:alpha/beta fold hydrolase [Planctomycetota bacterium]
MTTVAPRRARALRLVRRLLVLALIGYAALAGMLYVKQDAMLFPRQYTHLHPDSTPPTGARGVVVTLADGTSVEGWYRPGAGRSPESPGPGVIFCHGNAELIDDRLDVMREYSSRGVGVLLMEYPGYGRSTGAPSETSIREAGARFFDLLAGFPEVDPSRIVAHGVSLGGGAAGQIARERPVAGLVLTSTFTSVASFAGRYYVPELLVRHPFRTDDVLRTFDGPVLIFHGVDDEIVPVAHGRALAAIARRATYVETPGRHNNYPPDPRAHWAQIDAFFRANAWLPAE